MSTPRILAALVEEAVAVGDLVRLLTLRQGQANLVEVTLPAGTPIAGRPVRDLRLPSGSALVAILRGGRVIVPQGDHTVEAGDELLFVASADVEQHIREATRPLMAATRRPFNGVRPRVRTSSTAPISSSPVEQSPVVVVGAGHLDLGGRGRRPPTPPRRSAPAELSCRATP